MYSTSFVRPFSSRCGRRLFDSSAFWSPVKSTRMTFFSWNPSWITCAMENALVLRCFSVDFHQCFSQCFFDNIRLSSELEKFEITGLFSSKCSKGLHSCLVPEKAFLTSCHIAFTAFLLAPSWRLILLLISRRIAPFCFVVNPSSPILEAIVSGTDLLVCPVNSISLLKLVARLENLRHDSSGWNLVEYKQFWTSCFASLFRIAWVWTPSIKAKICPPLVAKVTFPVKNDPSWSNTTAWATSSSPEGSEGTSIWKDSILIGMYSDVQGPNAAITSWRQPSRMVVWIRCTLSDAASRSPRASPSPSKTSFTVWKAGPYS